MRVKTRPYDWFICSVFGFAWTLYYWPFCVCWPGVCAMYYAIRVSLWFLSGVNRSIITFYTNSADLRVLRKTYTQKLTLVNKS